MALLEARSLTVRLANFALLDNIDLSVEAGEVVALIGPNGAGKTSLIRALMQDLALTSGLVTFGNKPLAELTLQRRARAIAVLPQHNVLNFPFVAEEVVQLGRIPHNTGTTVDQSIVQAALAEMDILYLKQRPYTLLSGGEKQRVHLARVMTQVWRSEDAPQRLLVLDEPTSSLDISHTGQLMNAIRRFARDGAGVILILHDVNVAAQYADRIVAISCGRVESDGTPQQVLTTDNMRRIFGVEATIVQHPNSGRSLVVIDD